MEFAARIPPRLKMKGLREKHILREAMGHLLPPAIGSRPKQPYRAPDAHSFVGANAREYVQSMMSDHALANAGAFNPRAVAKLQQKCAAAATLGFRDNAAFVGVLSPALSRRLRLAKRLASKSRRSLINGALKCLPM